MRRVFWYEARLDLYLALVRLFLHWQHFSLYALSSSSILCYFIALSSNATVYPKKHYYIISKFDGNLFYFSYANNFCFVLFYCYASCCHKSNKIHTENHGTEAGVKQKLTLLGLAHTVEFFPEVKSKFNPTSQRYKYIRYEQAQVKIQNRQTYR